MKVLHEQHVDMLKSIANRPVRQKIVRNWLDLLKTNQQSEDTVLLNSVDIGTHLRGLYRNEFPAWLKNSTITKIKRQSDSSLYLLNTELIKLLDEVLTGGVVLINVQN